MKSSVKNTALSLLAGACALTLCGAVALQTLPEKASAADAAYTAFIDVGANTDAVNLDRQIDMQVQSTVFSVTPGTTVQGGSFFESYVENGSLTVTVPDGSYDLAVAVEGTEKVSIGGTQVDPVADPVNDTGHAVAHAAVSAGSVTVSYSGKIYGAVLAPAGEKVMFAVEVPEGEIIPYGSLIMDEVDNATAYYSDGTAEEAELTYGNITAGTGLNMNFTTVDVTASLAGTDRTFARHITVMPDDLVYFINCGSSEEVDAKYADENTIDEFYSYNQLVWDYYGSNLKNYGKPDQVATKGGGDWGIYTKYSHTAPGDSSFPYNSIVWTDQATDMGYMLTNLTAEKEYRIWIGTLSHWHARTVTITFNDEVVGTDNLRIASKDYAIFENVKADAAGKIDIHMQGASTNEPTICFIAVQEMTTALPAKPGALTGNATVGIRDTAMTLNGVTDIAGAKIQIYNASKPNQLLYEEAIDSSRLSGGSYRLDWGRELYASDRVARFYAVQLTKGGASEPFLVSITDVEGTKDTDEKDIPILSYDVTKYSAQSAEIRLRVRADSGIAKWEYRLGEYGVPVETTYEILKQNIDETFSVTENGLYYVTITSGRNVTLTQTVNVTTVDKETPSIEFAASTEGWKKGAYNVKLNVTAVSPVNEYHLYRDGEEIAKGQNAPSVIKFEKEGEYTVVVRTASGRTAAKTLRVSKDPATAKVTRKYERRQLTYVFEDTDAYKISSIAAYKLDDGQKMTVSSGNTMDVFDAGTYVVSVTSTAGTVEMFSFSVTRDQTRGRNLNGGLSGSAALGVGLGVGLGGLVLAAGAVLLTFFLKKKH